MNQYGLTHDDLLECREKIKNQKEYLEKNQFITSNGQFKNLKDISFSANISYRYYAQLANKINTMEAIALNKSLKPIFLTMTLDGFFRDFLKGDYSRFKKLSDGKLDETLKSIPDNERFGFIREKVLNHEKLNIKELYNILNFQMRQFRGSKAFRTLKKSGLDYEYIRTVEPHRDGVPHFHMMLFVPAESISIFKEQFIKFFVAPRNKTDEAFQTDIDSASAYIMKYITKTFKDIKKDKELDYINSWFVKHRILRCITSRTLLPQWVYQKISILSKDWYYLTDILSSSIESEWSKEHNSFWIYDRWNDREIEYLYGRLSIYSRGVLVNRVGELRPKVGTSLGEKVPTSWKKKKDKIPIFENGKISYFFKNGNYYEYEKHITDMNDFELINYYYSYDVETKSYTHYLAVRNLMITRNLLRAELYNLNNFSIDKFFSLEK